ncbi:9abd6c18-e524-4ffb-8b72-b16b846583ac [Thermothielavioides terrestris]|nr:9abd6c18-e524-4ffb-8b72-b16b846583ac [Thermothielavioides terrestris]
MSSGTPFLITGPRHGFSLGWETLKDGLEIYTGAFHHVNVDVEASTMTIGGAASMKDVSDALQLVGKNIPVGGSSCVGMVGASLGGGIGRLQGLYGLMHDSMLSARLMLPNTTVVEVSECSHPELFWGLRGAGFNFGFVLNATYRVYDAPAGGTNFNADFEFPMSSVRAFYQALHDQIEIGMPAPLCLSTALQFNHAINATTLKVNAVYAGPEDEGRRAVEFLADLGTDLRHNFTQVPWNRLNRNVDFLNNNPLVDVCNPGGIRGDTYGVAVNTIDVDAHVSVSEQFDDMMAKYPEMRSSGNGGYFCANQAVVARPKHHTAYPWRQAVGYQTFGFVYGANTTTTEADIDNLPTKLRDTIAATAGTQGGLNVYVGFSHGNEPATAIWSEANLPRLRALKREYDPKGLFNWYHPIPLE